MITYYPYDACNACMYYLVTEVQELEQNLPKTCKLRFEDPNKLYSFFLTIVPDESYWQGGLFKFSVDVPDDYNIVVS